MPGASSGYLPPVVAVLVGEAADALDKIAETKAAIEDLSKTPTTFTLTAETALAIANIAKARAEATAIGEPPITFTVAINSAQALAELAVIRAIAGSAAAISIPLTANIAPLITEMAVAKAAADSKGGALGVIGSLLWGKAGFAGFAAFGTIASLAGFGFEHALTLMIGLAGSLAGALGGLGILAIGVFGKMAVGMGSDALVMSSTIADTKTLGAALTAIQTAQLTYGENSAQAAAATKALNVQMLLLGNTAGVRAELGLAKMGQALNSFWDQATSAARVAAVGFIEPFLSVAYTYIPLIAQAAARNFTIMTAAFKPLIAWANGPGVAIFKNLENLFAASIPTGVHALTQFVELLAKIANFAAPKTGSLLASIDRFLTGLNTASGFARLEGVMTTMIGMFHDWWDLLKQIGITIYDLFSQSVGLGTTIVTTLTSMLKHLDAWLTSTSGKASVHNLFAVHLQEIQAILAVLPSVLGAFGRLYLAVAPPLVILVTGLADAVGWMLKIPGVGPIMGWAIAIGILAWRLKLLAIGGGIVTAVKWIAGFVAGLLGIVPAAGAADGALAAFGVAVDFATGGIALIVEAAIAIGVGLFLLLTHLKQVTAFLNSSWGQAFQIAVAVVFPFIGIPLLIITHWQQIVTFFGQLPRWIMQELGKLPGQLLTFFSRIPGAIWTGLTKGLPLVLGWFLSLGGKILGALAGLAGTLLGAAGKGIAGFVKGLVGALPTILAWFIELPFWILAKLTGAAWWLIKTGAKVVTGFVGGLAQDAPHIWKWFLDLPKTILHLLVSAATWLWNTGISVITGFFGGIKNNAPNVWNWFTGLPKTIPGLLGKASTWLYNIGRDVITGLWNGLKSVWSNVVSWLGNIGKTIAGFFKSALGINSPSTVMHDIGQNVMLGLQMGLEHGVGGVMGVMAGMSAQLRGAISPGKLALSGQATATILHAIGAASLPASSTGMGSSSLPGVGAVGAGNQSLSMPIELNVTVPPGTPASVAQQIGTLAQDAVNKALYKSVRQMRGGARTYGFMPS